MNPRLPTLTEAYQQGRDDERRNWTADGSTHYDGCAQYHPRCEARMLRNVLTDLIAELRTTPRSPSARPPLWVRLSVAHAEARLREIGGDDDV